MAAQLRIRDVVGGTEIVTTADCWALIGSTHLGRVAVANRSGVEVFPVGYSTEEDRIEFATNLGSKLLGIFDGAWVFQVDHLDQAGHTGWSVMVHGHADISELDEATQTELPQWAGTKKYLVRLTPSKMTGRRLEAAEPASKTGPAELGSIGTIEASG